MIISYNTEFLYQIEISISPIGLIDISHFVMSAWTVGRPMVKISVAAEVQTSEAKFGLLLFQSLLIIGFLLQYQS